MRRVCAVDVSGVAIGLLDWKPAGDPGTFAKIEHWPEGMGIEPVFDTVLSHYPGHRRATTVFSRLVPGQFFEPHVDKADGHCRKRIHVPIKTNPGVIFVEGGHAFHMAAGWAWEIDPNIVHCTGNGGEIDRIHLFFNMVLI